MRGEKMNKSNSSNHSNGSNAVSKSEKRRSDLSVSSSQNDNQLPKVMNGGDYPKSRDSGYKDAIPGINTPRIELPAVNPPVPNRAWTAMRKSLQNDALSKHEENILENEINNI
jgi:hypothetical protein